MVDFVDTVESMSTVPAMHKSKVNRAKVRCKPERKRSGHARAFAKVAVNGGKFSVGAINDIARQIKAQLSTIQTGQGRRAFDFTVIFDGQQIRLDPARIARPRAKAAKVKTQFDPKEAGRKVVAQLQEAEGGAWSGQELAETFRLTPATLHKRRTEYRIVSWRDAKHRFHYPKWQFTPTGALLAGVQDVLQTFRSSDEWRVMSYFLAPRHQLGNRTPLDLLRAGEMDKVIAHARAHGEENSW